MTDIKALLHLNDKEEAVLARHSPGLLALTPRIVDDLYDFIATFPALAELLKDEETCLKHRAALGHYLDSLTAGEYGEEYVNQRRHIGEVHFHVGMKPKWYLAAYRKLLSSFAIHLGDYTGTDVALHRRILNTVFKVAFLDMQLALDNYFDASTRALQAKKSIADSALRIFASTSSVAGNQFFEVLACSMKRELCLPYVYVIELKEGTHGPHRILASAAAGAPVVPEKFEWPLVERCMAESSNTLIQSAAVRELLPDSAWLREAKAESLGLSLLRDSANAVVGMLVVAGTEAMEDEHRVATLLPLFSARAAMEMEHIRFDQHLAHQATHDALTGLPNRTLLDDRLQRELFAAERRGQAVAVMFMDLDDFKDVNDCYGHETGDRLLINFAARLRETLREEDTVARYGGDEFVVVLGQISDATVVERVAQKLIAALSYPIDIHGQRFHAKASIGIALYPEDGRDPATLLRNADTALYRTKESPHLHYQFFTGGMNADVVRRVALEEQLRLACEREEMSLHYQPQIELKSGRIVGIEALLRWRHPHRGNISPAEFIPIAESSGLIVDIGDCAIDRACRDLARWRAEGHTGLRLAVNISARQFESRAIFDTVIRCLDHHDIPHDLFEIELTESLLMANPDATKELLRDFRRAGISISMDDFGTGYSSLSYLKQYPIQRLKIDQSFVRDIVDDANDVAIVKAIIAMANALGIAVIAEGIETRAQCEMLKSWGCLEAQGYYFSRPVAAEAISELLANVG